MPDNDELDPDDEEFDDPLMDEYPVRREPDEIDHSLEPIMVDLCKIAAFQIRDSAPVVPSMVSLDLGYRAEGDPEELERHMRIQFRLDDNFEEEYMKFAARRLLDDAKRIIDGTNEENDDPK